MRTYKYRCYPGQQAQAAANRIMACVVKPIWNEAQRERQENFDARCKAKTKEEKPPKWVSWYSQRHLIDPKTHPDYEGTRYGLRDGVLAALDWGYKSCWALRKNGHKDARPPGPMKWCDWVTYRWRDCRLDGHTLRAPGIGDIPVRMHRPVGGRIKTVTIRVKNAKWYVYFSCEIENFPGACRSLSGAKARKGKGLRQKHPESGGTTPQMRGVDNENLGGYDNEDGGTTPQMRGVDNVSEALNEVTAEMWGADNFSGPRSRFPTDGCTHQSDDIVVIWLRPEEGCFLADSTGRWVDVPGFYEAGLPEERRLNRLLSQKKRRSNGPDSPEKGRNQYKARLRLAKFREHVANQRSAFLWSEAKYYATRYRQIEIISRPAKIPIQYAKDERTARGLCDGAYGLFEQRLAQKCEEYGTEFRSKERSTWLKEKEVCQEQGKMEKLQPILRKAKRKVKRRIKGLPASTRSLQRACEELTTWQIT